MYVSLCCLKIEITSEMNSEEKKGMESVPFYNRHNYLIYLVSETSGAVSTEHPNNPRVVREYRGQRKPRKIKIENYASSDIDPTIEKGILPSSSRETTPMDEPLPPEYSDDKTVFSGNPFVEVTQGIIHMYKKK